jgi:hypothetical protein
MQDYLCDFRQRLDGRADVLGGRVKEKQERTSRTDTHTPQKNKHTTTHKKGMYDNESACGAKEIEMSVFFLCVCSFV